MYDKKAKRTSLAELWRDQAAALRCLLNRQNRELLLAARERDRLAGLVQQWAQWRTGQCDIGQASQQELDLLEAANVQL